MSKRQPSNPASSSLAHFLGFSKSLPLSHFPSFHQPISPPPSPPLKPSLSLQNPISTTMPINKESTPPPVIGKAGRYTVFLTPPTTPKPSTPQSKPSSPQSKPIPDSSKPIPDSPKPQIPVQIAPPVQPPPQQFPKSTSVSSKSDSSGLGFFWKTVAKVQNAHSSLDSYLADWFGLDHSKYQWALDDYYESKGMEKGSANALPKEAASKAQSV